MPSLYGVNAKRERAQQHFDILEKSVREFFDKESDIAIAEPDPEQCRYIVRLCDPQQIPAREWALLIGDCIHNLRSIYDYVAWELAGADPADTKTIFPVCDTEKSWGEAQGRVRRIPNSFMAVIEKMQPYKALATGRDPHLHFLWPLHALDISDKHKLLTLTVAQPTRARLRFYPPPGIQFNVRLVYDAAFKDKAEIAYIELSEFVPNMRVEAHPTFDVAFDESIGIGKRQFVIRAISKIMQQTDMFIEMCGETFFKGPPAP